ncbi:MAG: hypothetical protein K9J17_16225 [Flavobacteriales bacterium]|nr:hypothetical protein [Flavobacteriales bacterium]
MNRLFALLGVCLNLIGMQSCTKESDPPQTTEFNFTAPDTVVFEHSDTKTLEVSVMSATAMDFVANLSCDNSSFQYGGEIVIASNQSGTFNIQFNQFGVAPASYDCNLTVSVANENNLPQSKSIQLRYAPNCAYDFKDHQNGQITYQINGNLQNRSIDCSYNNEGQLVVDGLTTYQVVLNLNCSAGTVTMDPITNIGSYMTADGTIQGSVIHLNFYSDGALHAVGKISI